MNGAGSWLPGPGRAGGPRGNVDGGGVGPAGASCSVRAPGGAWVGIGTGVPGTFGGGSPGRPAIGSPGVGGRPSGFGGDVATSTGAGKPGPPNGPMAAPAQGSGFHGRGRPSSPTVTLPPGLAGGEEDGE